MYLLINSWVSRFSLYFCVVFIYHFAIWIFNFLIPPIQKRWLYALAMSICFFVRLFVRLSVCLMWRVLLLSPVTGRIVAAPPTPCHHVHRCLIIMFPCPWILCWRRDITRGSHKRARLVESTLEWKSFLKIYKSFRNVSELQTSENIINKRYVKFLLIFFHCRPGSLELRQSFRTANFQLRAEFLWRLQLTDEVGVLLHLHADRFFLHNSNVASVYYPSYASMEAYIGCCFFSLQTPVTYISAPIGMKFCMMVYIGPGQISPLDGSTPERPKSEISGLNLGHLTANSSKMVSCSATRQLALRELTKNVSHIATPPPGECTHVCRVYVLLKHLFFSSSACHMQKVLAPLWNSAA